MGKRNLETAVQQAAARLDVKVEWAPYMLKRGIPEEGVLKPGGPGRHQVNPRLADAGKAVGIDFTGLCPRFPNTAKAHALLAFALETAGAEAQNSLQEVLFRHYFTDGKYPDVENLVLAAHEAGLPQEEARKALEGGQFEAKVVKEAEAASRKGISGVPYFFINGRPVFSGAQPPKALLEALENM